MDLLDILEDKGIRYKKTNNPSEIVMRCTHPDHDDSDPSLSFNLDKNVFNCWACGFRGGVTKFLASIGITEVLELESKQPHKISKIKEKLKKYSEVSLLEIPADARPFNQDYRSISAKTFRDFEAFTTSEMNLLDYLCFPIYQFGKLRFIEGRDLNNLENQSKYSRKPAKSKVSDILFPIDKVKGEKQVILVEGLFDMLNLWDLGYENVLCIFGANNFNREKLNILDNLGVVSVLLVLDPDKAGQKAAEKIADLLDSKNIVSKNILLPSGTDAGSINITQAMRYIK